MKKKKAYLIIIPDMRDCSLYPYQYYWTADKSTLNLITFKYAAYERR